MSVADSPCAPRSDQPSSGSLTTNRSFLGLVGAQFFGAFNDNLFKQLILFLAARELFPGEDKQGLAFTVFALPFILFSSIAGDMSERHSKREIILGMKLAELGIMGLGAVALQFRSWYAMLVVLFVMGTHSAFFGPAKYGVIPELVSKTRLMGANGLISMTTFLAILFGQALAGPLLDRHGTHLWVTGAWCVGFAVVGLLAALTMKPLAAREPGLAVRFNPLAGVGSTLRDLRRDPRILHLLLLNSLFWFNGGVLQQAMVSLGAPAYLDIAATENWRISLLLVVLATSIIVGSLVAPPLSRWIRPGKLIAIGAGSMLVCQVGLHGAIATLGSKAYVPSLIIVAILGLMGAQLAVPIQTFLQDAPLDGTRGKTFAVNNFLNFTFIFLAGLYYMLLSALHVAPSVASAGAGLAMCLVLIRFRSSVLSVEKPQ